MLRHHFKTTVLISIASALGLVTLASSVSAAPTRVGIQQFALTSSITEEGGGTVVASGFFNETGHDIVVNDTEDTFVFPSGQITVNHSALRSHDKFDEKKCTFSFTEEGVYVFGGGTGTWAGYNGSGTYTVKVSGTNACTGPPVGTVTITAKGPINPPSTGN